MSAAREAGSATLRTSASLETLNGGIFIDAFLKASFSRKVAVPLSETAAYKTDRFPALEATTAYCHCTKSTLPRLCARRLTGLPPCHVPKHSPFDCGEAGGPVGEHTTTWVCPGARDDS